MCDTSRNSSQVSHSFMVLSWTQEHLDLTLTQTEMSLEYYTSADMFYGLCQFMHKFSQCYCVSLDQSTLCCGGSRDTDLKPGFIHTIGIIQSLFQSLS